MSLNATTASSSYTMSLGLWRVTMRQKRQSFTEPPENSCYNTASPEPPRRKGVPDGHLPEVQAAHSQERQSREARIRLASQDLPATVGHPHRQDRLTELRALPARSRRHAGVLVPTARRRT